MSRGFPGSKQVKKKLPMHEEIEVESVVHSTQQKLKKFSSRRRRWHIMGGNDHFYRRFPHAKQTIMS